MKCDSCRLVKMCHLSQKYQEIVSIVAQLTDAKGPEYTILCHRAATLYDGCIHYEAKE